MTPETMSNAWSKVIRASKASTFGLRRKKGVNRRGVGPIDGKLLGRGAGEGFGVHICTGPVYIRGAEPGDILEVRIMDVKPRPCAISGPRRKIVRQQRSRLVAASTTTTYLPSRSHAKCARSMRSTPAGNATGRRPSTISVGRRRLIRLAWCTRSSTIRACPVDHSTVQETQGILKNVRIPIRPHFGVMGLAPKMLDIVDSDSAKLFWRQYRQLAPRQGRNHVLSGRGGGRPRFRSAVHMQHRGDSEICGTAIEMSLTRNLPAPPAQKA